MSACKLYSLMLCQLSYAEGEMCDQLATSADTNGVAHETNEHSKSRDKREREPTAPRIPTWSPTVVLTGPAVA